jgi:hypothetical protein
VDSLVKTLLSNKVDIEFSIGANVVDVRLINMDTEEEIVKASGDCSEKALTNAVSLALEQGGKHWLFSRLH